VPASGSVRVVGLLLLAAALLGLDVFANELDPHRLQPGEFVWFPQAAPRGPLLMVVSIPEQRAYLYRNGVRIATSTVSTGKAGKETPPGIFTVLQKHKEHFSNLYDDAPMPFMQRLTWGGVALHAGRLPGYPASLCCIRLPTEFARRLFEVSELGMTVIVSDERASPPEWVHPGWLAPTLPAVDAGVAAPMAAGEDFTWSPDAAPPGPLTILVSTFDRRLRVLRNGIEIGSAAIDFDGAAPSGTYALQLQEGRAAEESRFVPGKPRLRWLQVPLEGVSTAPAAVDELYRGLRVSPRFAQAIYDSLVPGTSVVVTDMPAGPVGYVGEILDTAPEQERR
jgi:hypothetical protein